MDCSSFSSSSVSVRFLWASEVGLELTSLCPKVLGRDMIAIEVLSNLWEHFVKEALTLNGQFIRFYMNRDHGVASLLRKVSYGYCN